MVCALINSQTKTSPFILLISFLLLLFSSCQNKSIDKTIAASSISDSISKLEPSSTSKSDPKEIFPDTGKQNASVKLIVGTYVAINEPEESEQCEMTIIIEKASAGYIYHFKTEDRSLSGKLSVEATEGKDGYYITLEGIEWSEYEGELDDDGEAKVKDLALPKGINGVIQDSEITIQNTGNSMNYYVKLEDCGKKYIRLKKQ
jgi:hypothetical protein